ncbi:MAG: MFS transporter [bacterium]
MEKIKFRMSLFLYLAMSYLCIGLVSNMAGMLLPYWVHDFKLESTVLTLLNSMIFIAYGLASLPHGILSRKIGQKKSFLLGLLLITSGSLTFGAYPSYITGLISLFVIGTGVSALQISGAILINKISDYEEDFPKNMTMTQLFYGIGSALGGLLLNQLISVMHLPWAYTYFVFAALLVLIFIFGLFLKVPAHVPNPNPTSYLDLLRQPFVLIFCLGIFIYVGIEVGFATWIPTFLTTIKKFSTHTTYEIMFLFWATLATGRLLGGALMKRVEAHKLLTIYAAAAPIFITIAVISPFKSFAVLGLLLVGLVCSIMYPVIFSSAVGIAGREKETSMAGLLCFSIIGGAVTSPIMGYVSKLTNNLSLSLVLFASLSFIYIAFVGIYAGKKKAV